MIKTKEDIIVFLHTRLPSSFCCSSVSRRTCPGDADRQPVADEMPQLGIWLATTVGGLSVGCRSDVALNLAVAHDCRIRSSQRRAESGPNATRLETMVKRPF